MQCNLEIMDKTAQTIVFRVDASLQIGTGHVMRCLTLADVLRRKGAICHFICRGLQGNLGAMIAGRGYPVHTLPVSAESTFTGKTCYAEWLGCSWETDAQQTAGILKEILPDWLVVDHYALDVSWEQVVSQSCKKLFVIDDLADRHHQCDLLLDQTYERKPSVYQALVPQHCNILTGTAYALLRPEFAHIREYHVLDNVDSRKGGHLLIAMGGVDKDNVTGMVLNVLQQHPSALVNKITVILGAATPWLSSVRKQADSYPCDVSVKVDVTDMAVEMEAADYAIGAAGTTSWERCCLGIPAVTLPLADNQKEVAEALSSARVVELVKPDKLISHLSKALDNISADYNGYRYRCLRVCDGLGAFRTAQHLDLVSGKTSLGPAVWLRPADSNDIKRVFDWQCMPDIRKYARNPNPPAWEEHQSWMQKQLQDVKSYFYIIQLDANQVGVARLARMQRGCYEVSIYLDPKSVGRGIGKRALRMLAETHEDIDIIATVLEANQASHRLFSAAGFTRINSQTYILKRTVHEKNVH